jgi:hypothetical protein
MAALDRAIRETFLDLRRSATTEERAELDRVWSELVEPIDRRHSERLKALVGDRGWFRNSDIGARTGEAAFLLIQHSDDVGFQKQVWRRWKFLEGSRR